MKRLPILNPKIIITKDERAQKVRDFPGIMEIFLLNLNFIYILSFYVII
jgi:hypothetical protein